MAVGALLLKESRHLGKGVVDTRIIQAKLALRVAGRDCTDSEIDVAVGTEVIPLVDVCGAENQIREVYIEMGSGHIAPEAPITLSRHGRYHFVAWAIDNSGMSWRSNAITVVASAEPNLKAVAVMESFQRCVTGEGVVSFEASVLMASTDFVPLSDKIRIVDLWPAKEDGQWVHEGRMTIGPVSGDEEQDVIETIADGSELGQHGYWRLRFKGEFKPAIVWDGKSVAISGTGRRGNGEEFKFSATNVGVQEHTDPIESIASFLRNRRGM